MNFDNPKDLMTNNSCRKEGISSVERMLKWPEDIKDQPKSNPKIYIDTYNLNFSFHFGDKVNGFTEVACMNLAGTGPPNESLCSLLGELLSFLLKLNRKLCFLCTVGISLPSPPSNPISCADKVLGVIGGCWDGWGEGNPPDEVDGIIPSIQ